MKTQMYVIWDSKARVYHKPVHFHNDELALRAARNLVSDGDNEIRRNPEDFTLFHVGEYDDETASLQPSDKQRILCRFHEIQIPLELEDQPLKEVTS